MKIHFNQPPVCRTLRIAMVANIRLPANNAAARRVTILAGAFARLGQKVTLFMPFPNQTLAAEDLVDGVTMQWGMYPDPKTQWLSRSGRISMRKHFVARFSWARQMLAATVQHKYDWLYIYAPSPEGAFLACLARLAGRKVAVEQVDGFYYTRARFSLMHYGYIHLLRLSMWIAKSMSSLVVIISSTLASQCRGRYTLLRVPALVDCARFATGDPKRMHQRLAWRQARWVVYTGSLSAHAGFQFLMAAMVEVVKHVPDAYLAFAGYAGNLEGTPGQMIEKHGLQNHAEYLGMLNYQDVVDLMALADVLVMPKASSGLNEMGFPTKLAEYLAAGKPVVATRISDIPEYMTHGKNACLCNPDDVADLSRTIVGALESGPEERTRVGKAGRELACDTFDVTLNAARILDAMSG